MNMAIAIEINGMGRLRRVQIIRPECKTVNNSFIIMDDTEYVTIEVLGSKYESEWNLLAGEYKFRVSSSMRSLVFKSKAKVVTIERSFIKDYGIRVRNGEKLYFFTLGRRNPFGRGDIVIRSLSFGIEKFNFWVRERMITSKAKISATLTRQTMNKPSRHLRHNSTSELSNPLTKISHFLGIFKGKKKKPKNSALLLPGEEYSEVDDKLTCSSSSYQYQTAEDVSDTETGGLVLPPASTIKKRYSCKCNHLKWHEKEETYSEYVPEYTVPVNHKNENEVVVTESGDIYRLPEPKDKQLPKRTRKKSLDENKNIDYYNTNTAAEPSYYNLESRLISEESIEE